MKKRILSGLMIAAVMSMVLACGAAAKGSLTDQAAVRGAEEGKGEYYIDNEAIALASRAATTQTMDVAIQTAYDLCNAHRANSKLAGYVYSNALADAAKVRAKEIVGTFSHTRPNGSAFWTVNSDVQWGENLAKLYNSADTVVAAWMASPTHAANILAGDFKSVGLAIYQSGNNWYWAQEFGY